MLSFSLQVTVIIMATSFVSFSISVFYMLLAFTDDIMDFSMVNIEGHKEQEMKDDVIFHKLDKVMEEMKSLEKENLELKKVLEILNNSGQDKEIVMKKEAGDSKGVELGNLSTGERSVRENLKRYMDLRRYVHLDLKEFWYHIRGQSGKLKVEDLDQVQDLYRQIQSNLLVQLETDDLSEFRTREIGKLEKIVQGRIEALQNPEDCDSAKKSLCLLVRDCGFGCHIHDLGKCLIAAYSTSRTLLLESRLFNYNTSGGWESAFLPLSLTCPNTTRYSIKYPRSKNYSMAMEFLRPVQKYLPVVIPSDIGVRLEGLHGEPDVWWVGQFMKYILRLQPHMQTTVDEHKRKLGIVSPTLGIHVRRTDKIETEADLHPLKEYMDHAEEYYAILQKVDPTVIKRVFIASDDPSVILESHAIYAQPKWTILSDPDTALSASDVTQRYSQDGLEGIIKDIFMLAECDFLVCTFSSQVCKLAYELMQTKHPDASGRFVSLDDVYFYPGGNVIEQIVHSNHNPRNEEEIELRVGDTVQLAGNHWNGWSKGTNLRTHKLGIFPSHKVRTRTQTEDFPQEK